MDAAFWQSMVKIRQHGAGSGSFSTISGWLSILFPYLPPEGGWGARADKDNSGRSPHMRHWKECTQPSHGPRPEHFPSLLSSAPVRWDYFGDLKELHFHAGPIGCRIDPASGAIAPCNGWVITHDPPMEPAAKLAQLHTLRADLMKAHGGDEHAIAWRTPYQLSQLDAQIASLEKMAACSGA